MFNGENVEPVVRARLDRAPDQQRRHARLLLLDQAGEQVRRHRLRQRASAAAAERPRLRKRSAAGGISSGHGVPQRQLRARQVQLHEERRRLRRVLAHSRGASGSGFGYDYWNLDQTRVDYDKAHASTVFARVQEHDARHAERPDQSTGTSSATRRHNFSNDGVSPNDPNFLLPFTSAFDMQDLTTNEVRLYLDWTPMPLLGVSFEGNWARNNYNNVTLRPDRQRPAGLLPERELG